MATQTIEQEADINRIFWTLKDGATPLQRIYSTLKHLRSQITLRGTEELVELLVRKGQLQKQPHPVREGQYFYSLANKE